MHKLTQSEFQKKVIDSREKIVIVDFFADWCGPCRQLSPILEEISDEFSSRVDIYKVDVGQEADLARTFEVLSIPTVLFFKNGKKVDEFVGLRDKDSIVEMIQSNI
ncbi:MAG: thioredoxin [Chlamydiae bacterium RIFCSPHIGHO2_12_FULL_49_11]|nr:MAG: thioredoxin [Chlamydiae bacterium RIFCSPHIGHO2_12_FULL_49_11]